MATRAKTPVAYGHTLVTTNLLVSKNQHKTFGDYFAPKGPSAHTLRAPQWGHAPSECILQPQCPHT